LPTISSVTAGWGTYLNATEDNSTGTVTVVTSGAENDQTVSVAFDNGDNYTGTVSNNSTSVTFAASGLQALTDGDNYTLTTNVSDAAGNPATVNTGTSFTYDITAPTISGGVAITSVTGIQNNLLNAGDNVSVTATFSENSPVTGTPQLTLAVGDDNQTATYSSSGNGGTTLVFKYTIQAGDNDTNGISIRANALALDNGTISDLAGNNAILTHSAVDNNSSYKVDTTPPTVNSFTLSDTALKAGDNATVTLDFSEVVASFSSADDITVDNGTLATMTSCDNKTWEGTFTPTANTEDDNNTLSLATSYTDLAGNAGPAATTANYAIDTLLPTISSVTAGWGTFLNATEDNSDGTVTIVTSGAENGQRVTVALNGTNYFDTVSDNSTSVTFAASGLQALTDGDNYTLTTNVSDAAGNAATVNTGTSFTYDITTPMISGGVAITSATGIQNNLLNAGDNVSVTATFSKNVPVTGTPQLTLAVGDDNQTATYASSGNGGTTLVFKYTIQAGDNDTNGISIRANALALDNGTISDLAGNNAIRTHSAVDNNSSYKVDTEAPRVDNFTLSDTALKAGDNATVTLVFSEAVASFASSADITVANGTLAVMTSTDNITWAGTFTPTANTEDDNNTLSLATSYTDTAGNTGPAATTLNYVVDTTAPSVSSFTLSDTALITGDNATVTLVFSEAVASFSSSADITVANGTLAVMTSTDNITWAGTFTPTANTEDDNNTLSLATSYTDTAGNTGPAATTLNYVVDTTAPTVSSISTTADNQSSVSITDNFTVTFSEAMESSYVTTSTSDTNCAGSIRVSSDNYSTCVKMSSEPVSSNSNRTFTLDPYDNLTVGSTYLTRVTTGVKDTAGNAMSSQYDNSTGFAIVDLTAPTVSSVSTTADNQSSVAITDNITVTFSEAMDNTSVTTNTDNASCSGTLGVSSDNFSNCVQMSSAPASSSDNMTFTLDPSGSLTGGTTYKTRVTTGVKDTAGNAMSSQYETSSGFATLLPAPDNLSAIGANNTITLTWNSVSGATSYTLYWDNVSGIDSSDTAITSITNDNYTHSNMDNGSTYYYKVAAVNSSGTGTLSSVASALLSANIQGSETYSNHTYAITTSAMNWENAKIQAASLGGYLATINTKAENDWLTAKFISYGNVWIGSHDKATEGTWVWDNGTTSDDSGVSDNISAGAKWPDGTLKWDSGEPNDSGSAEDCGTIRDSSGEWNDVQCNSSLSSSAYHINYGIIEFNQ